MPAPAGLIVGWPSTVASIPAGWSRVAAMNSRFPRQAATAGGTGGSSTHTHTPASSHTHSAEHSHSMLTDTSSGPVGVDSPNFAVVAADAGHQHSGSSDSGGGTSGSAAAAASSSSSTLPGRYTVIWIESDGSTAIPQNAIHWIAGTSSVPTGWAECTGAGGTPDLRELFLVGAAVGADGGTRTTLTAHNHVWNHTHSFPSHTHNGGAASNEATGTVTVTATFGAVNAAPASHTHVSIGSLGSTGSSGTSSSPTSNASSESVDPSWWKIRHVQKTTADDNLPSSIICVWDGLAASIPTGWNACNGTAGTPNISNGRFLKGATGTGQVNTTGGSDSHSHSFTHTHTIAHSHNGGSTGSVSFLSPLAAGGDTVLGDHSHASSLAVESDRTLVNQSVTLPTATGNSLPPYIDVIFIMRTTVAQTNTDTLGPIALTETEALVVTTTDDDTLGPIALSEAEAVFALTLTLDDPSPDDVEPAATIPVAWTLTDDTQYSYRVEVASDSGGVNVVYDSGVQISTDASMAIPPGSLQTDGTYWVRVSIVGDTGLEVRTGWVRFYTAFSTSENVANVRIRIDGHMCDDSTLPAAVIRWDAVSPAGDETFVEYDVRRTEDGGATWIRIATITDRLTTRWVDATVNAGTFYEYSVLWQADSPGGRLVSTAVAPYPSARLLFEWTFLHEVADPTRYVRLLGYDITYRRSQDASYRRAWGNRRPTAFIGEGFSTMIRISTLEQARRQTSFPRELVEIIQRQYEGAGPLCLRVGVDRLKYFCQIMSDSTIRSAGQAMYASDVELQETEYTEDLSDA